MQPAGLVVPCPAVPLLHAAAHAPKVTAAFLDVVDCHGPSLGMLIQGILSCILFQFVGP